MAPKVGGQIETPRPPDPIMRRPCADREEKRVIHGRDMRNAEQLFSGDLHQKGRPEVYGLVDANPTAMRYSNGEQNYAEGLQTDR
jgi:hypothetical protein